MTFKIPVLGSGESVQHMELRFNKATFGRKWLEIGIKRMNKTIRTFLQSVSKNQDITSLIRPWISDEYDDLSIEIKQKSNSSQDDTLLVLFTKDPTHLQKLSAISKVSVDETEHHSRSRRSTRRRRKDCHLSSMQVNFNRLGWGQYIIFPKFYDAKVCKGICAPAVTQEKAATNHAVMQSLMRESTNGRIPLPCCVPKSLSPISILYVEEKQFLVKHHKNMVVEECGCEWDNIITGAFELQNKCYVYIYTKKWEHLENVFIPSSCNIRQCPFIIFNLYSRSFKID